MIYRDVECIKGRKYVYFTLIWDKMDILEALWAFPLDIFV